MLLVEPIQSLHPNRLPFLSIKTREDVALPSSTLVPVDERRDGRGLVLNFVVFRGRIEIKDFLGGWLEISCANAMLRHVFDGFSPDLNSRYSVTMTIV